METSKWFNSETFRGISHNIEMKTPLTLTSTGDCPSPPQRQLCAVLRNRTRSDSPGTVFGCLAAPSYTSFTQFQKIRRNYF
ncbi:unnamed protein product, partial [Nesidiocoris tenuis]